MSIDISDVTIIPLHSDAISLLVSMLHNNSLEDCFLCRLISAPVPDAPGVPLFQSPNYSFLDKFQRNSNRKIYTATLSSLFVRSPRL